MNPAAQSHEDAAFARITAPSGDRPYLAYCFADGVIFGGHKVPRGAIEIVRGRREDVLAQMELKARHGHKRGLLLVPGVPEASDQDEAMQAYERWVAWCARNSLPGLTWNLPKGVERRA